MQEVADVSSSAARKSLIEGDVTRASTLLHPAVLVWCLQHGPWQPAAAFSTLSDISPPSLLPSAPSSASSSSPSWAHTPTATLKDVLAACPSPEVRDNASQYAERMRASGFDNVESILGYDDDMMREMREKLEAKGVPTIDAVTIVRMLEADTLRKTLRTLDTTAAAAARDASPPGTSPLRPYPRSSPAGFTRRSSTDGLSTAAQVMALLRSKLNETVKQWADAPEAAQHIGLKHQALLRLQRWEPDENAGNGPSGPVSIFDAAAELEVALIEEGALAANQQATIRPVPHDVRVYQTCDEIMQLLSKAKVLRSLGRIGPVLDRLIQLGAKQRHDLCTSGLWPRCKAICR